MGCVVESAAVGEMAMGSADCLGCACLTGLVVDMILVDAQLIYATRVTRRQDALYDFFLLGFFTLFLRAFSSLSSLVIRRVVP